MSKFGRAMILVYCAACLEKQQSEDVGMLQSRLLFDTSIDVKQDDKGASGLSMESNQSEQQKQESSQQDIQIVVQNLTSTGSRYFRTNRQDAGEGNIYYLDRHNLNCGTGVLQGFKLERTGCCQLNYIVKCSDTLPVIATDVKVLASNAVMVQKNSGDTLQPRQSTKSLTYMPVQCPDQYALQQVMLMRLPSVVEENNNKWEPKLQTAHFSNALNTDPYESIVQNLFKIFGVGETSTDKIGYEFKCVRMGTSAPLRQMNTPTTFGGKKTSVFGQGGGGVSGDGFYDAETFYLDRQSVFSDDSEYLLGFGLKREYENDSGIYYSYQYTVAR